MFLFLSSFALFSPFLYFSESGLYWIYRQPNTAKILVEAQAGNSTEDTGNDNIRDSVTVGQPFVPAEFAEDLLRRLAHGIVIAHDALQVHALLPTPPDVPHAFSVLKVANALS